MSVQPGPTFKRYAANGLAPTFAIPFLLLDAADLQITLNGVLVTAGFTLAGIGNPTSSCTFTVNPTGDLLFQQVMTFQRLTDYQTNGDFLAGTVNRDYDRLWLAVKQLTRDSGRALTVSLLEPEGIPPLPAKALRALKMLAFDADGNPIPSNLTMAQIEQQPTLALESAAAAAESAAAAADSEAAALSSEELAQKWAENPEDVPVVPGSFSAFNWARKALASALAAAAAVATAFASIRGQTLNLRMTTTGLSNVLTMTADQVIVESFSTPGQFKTVQTVAITPTLGVPTLDTGASVVASTWYHIWLFWNSTTDARTIRFSLNATGPVVPAGFTHGARLGALRTDASGSKFPLSCIWRDNVASLIVAAGSNVAALPRMASGIQGVPGTPTWFAVATGNYVPPTAKAIRVVLQSSDNGVATGGAIAAPNNSYGTAGGANPPPLGHSTAVANTGVALAMSATFVLESANIYYAANTASCGLCCAGWEDSL